eukprot:659320-Pelagomonas_calceolata.AAC.1
MVMTVIVMMVMVAMAILMHPVLGKYQVDCRGMGVGARTHTLGHHLLRFYHHHGHHQRQGAWRWPLLPSWPKACIHAPCFRWWPEASAAHLVSLCRQAMHPRQEPEEKDVKMQNVPSPPRVVTSRNLAWGGFR